MMYDDDYDADFDSDYDMEDVDYCLFQKLRLTDEQEEQVTDIMKKCIAIFLKSRGKKDVDKQLLALYKMRANERCFLENALKEAAILQGLTEDNIKKILLKKMTQDEIAKKIPTFNVVQYLRVKNYDMNMPIYLPFPNIDLLARIAACQLDDKGEEDTTYLGCWTMDYMKNFVFTDPMKVIQKFLDGCLIQHMSLKYDSCKRTWRNLNETMINRYKKSEEYKQMSEREQEREINTRTYEMQELMREYEVYYPSCKDIDSEERKLQTIKMYYEIEFMEGSYEKMIDLQGKLPYIEKQSSDEDALSFILKLVNKYKEDSELLALFPSQNQKILKGDLKAIIPLVFPYGTEDTLVERGDLSYRYMEYPYD